MSKTIDQLIEEAAQEIQGLLKSMKEETADMTKAEESSKEKSSSKEESSSKEASSMDKKEESSKEKSSSKEASSMAKDEGSQSASYENQAPEASDAAAPHQDSDATSEGEMESIEQMISGLSDEMLEELAQKVMMEMQGRHGQEQAAPEAAPAPAPEASPAAPAMKSEEDKNEKLAKSEIEQENEDLKKSVETLLTITETLLSRPARKSATDLSTVEYMKKSEEKPLSEDEVRNKVISLSKNMAKLGTLTKSELNHVQGFLANGKVTEEIIKIVNK